MKKNTLIVIVAIGFFMEWLDATALNTALPQIAIDFHVNPIYLKVALTSYLLSLGILIPASGWVADRYGIKRVYACAVVVFLIGSIGCGFSVGVLSLVVFRVLQGIGGAFLTPIGRVILLRVFGSDKFADAMTLVVIVSGLGMILGPLVGGGVTTWISWRWIFFINIPIALAGLIAIYFSMPAFDQMEALPSFDLVGFVCIGLGLGFVLLFFDVLVEPIVSLYLKLSLAFIACLFFIAYKQHAQRKQHPLINPILMANKKFILLTSGSFILRLAVATPPFLVPLLLQAGYHYSAFQSGVFMVAAAFGMMACKGLVKPIMRNFGLLPSLFGMTFINMLVLLSLSVVSVYLSSTALVVVLFLYGAGFSVQTTLMNVPIYQSVSTSLYSYAVPYNSSCIQLAGSFAIAIAALMIILQLHSGDLYHLIPVNAFKNVFAMECFFPAIALSLFKKALSEK